MPKLIPVRRRFEQAVLDAVNQRRLILQHCAACDRLQYPPQQACQVCGSAGSLAWKEVEGSRHIASYIVIEDGRLNRRMPDQPYNMAMVKLTRTRGSISIPISRARRRTRCPWAPPSTVTFEEVAPEQLIHEWQVLGYGCPV